MNIWAVIRDKETGDTEHHEAEGADYAAAHEALTVTVPAGWQVLAIWTDQYHDAPVG